MGFLVSPGVDVNEIDMTNVIPAVSTSIGGYAGPFRWGPVDQIVTVSSEKDLVSVYGKPDAVYAKSFFTAASFLKYGNALKVSRAYHSAMFNAIAGVVGAATAAANPALVKSIDSLPSTITDANFIAKYPGELGNSLSVIIVTPTNTDGFYDKLFDFTPTNDEIHLVVIDTNGAFTGTRGTVLEKYSGLSIFTDAKKDNGSNNYYKTVINNSSGYILANNLTNVYAGADASAVTNVKALNVAVSGATATGILTLSQSEYAKVSTWTAGQIITLVTHLTNPLKFNTSYNNVQIAQITVLSTNTSTYTVTLTAVTVNNSIVPSASIISTAGAGTIDVRGGLTVSAPATIAFASGTLVTNVFNSVTIATNANVKIGMQIIIATTTDNNVLITSAIIKSYVTAIGSPVSGNTLITFAPVLVSIPSTLTVSVKFIPASLQFQMTLGNDSSLASAEGTGTVNAILNFADADLVDVNLIFSSDSADTPTEAEKSLQLISTTRKDCVAFISAPLNISIKTSESDRLDLITAKFFTSSSALTRNSYSVFDSTPLYVYNKYLDNYLWIPACGHMAGLCANTDDVAEPWFSPAGYTRGQLLGVTKLGFNPNQASRDAIYKIGVNPIVSFPGQGIILFGDKTAQAKPSAFDRINVRRLFIVLEKAIATASKYQLFELNDEFTRAMFRNMVEPFLRDVKGRRGITDFLVVCDETNNTGEVIDGNRFVADIYIKPARSINFITLNFIATRTGVEFSEIVGK